MVAPTLSQLAAAVTTVRPHDGMGAAQQEVTGQTFAQVRTALIKALRASPDVREPLCDALELLERIQQRLEQDRQSAPPPPTPARPRVGLQEYQIQTSADGQFLTERRPGHSQPFRCPRATYDAAAEVLARAEQPMHFDELAERLNAHFGDRQPDYRLRVALRFWLGGNAVVRSRTKYRPADRSAFRDTARRLWEELAKRSARPQT